MLKDDKAYVVINASQMKDTLNAFGHNEKVSNKILIIGGGNIGFNLAKNIEQFHYFFLISYSNNEEVSKSMAVLASMRC